MAFDADFQRHIKKHSLDFIAKILGELDPVLPLLRSQVRGFHIIQGTMRNQTRFEHGAEIGKNEILKSLLGGIVEEQGTQHVT